MCNENEGHMGQFVYIRDDREDKEYFGLCEVEVFEHKGSNFFFFKLLFNCWISIW